METNQTSQTEVERKFLVEEIDKDLLTKHPGEFIHQTYLVPQEEGTVERVRLWVTLGTSLFFHTVKKPLAPGVNEETEREVGHEEYLELLNRRDPHRQPIRKVRRTWIENGQKWELDAFAYPYHFMLLEAEVEDLEGELEFPSGMVIGKEVTEDKRYTNYEIAEGRQVKEGVPEEPTKVIFLDFAGTIECATFEPDAIAALNAITDRTGAVIVISSDAVQRHHPERPHPLPQMEGELLDAGATGLVIGCTFQHDHEVIFNRPQRIQDWLDLPFAQRNVRRYVILDDVDLTDLKREYRDTSMTPEMAKHFVHISGWGLMDMGHAERAIEILNGSVAEMD